MRTGCLPTVMRHENWLLAYASVEGIGMTLRRVATRSARIAAIERGEDDLRRNYAEFGELFRVFMPELVAYVREWKRGN